MSTERLNSKRYVQQIAELEWCLWMSAAAGLAQSRYDIPMTQALRGGWLLNCQGCVAAKNHGGDHDGELDSKWRRWCEGMQARQQVREIYVCSCSRCFVKSRDPVCKPEEGRQAV